MRLHRLHGGLPLAPHKAESTATGIIPCPLPPRLILPLAQTAGGEAAPDVAPGQRVRRGQRLAIADGALGANLHAPASGTVEAIAPFAIPGAPRPDQICIVLRVDTDDESDSRLPPLAWREAAPEMLRSRIAEAGIVGLGGAGFPTAEKLSAARDLLVLNGVECEPWIACDDALLRVRADDVVRGGHVLRRTVGAARVLLAIEDSMREAIAAATAAIERHDGHGIELVIVPTRYPQGGERQLIKTLLGREVPSSGLPRDIGVLVQNVATAAAAWCAVEHGEPLLSRIVTVTGPGVRNPGNYEVAIGTPISHLVRQAGGYTERARRLLLGGPMMGIALAHDDFPITKTGNCVLVLENQDLPAPDVEMPCIRCGECARVCPAQLLPQQLHWFQRAGQFDRLQQHGVRDCIECGCCDLVCPSRIPLTSRFRLAKSTLAQRAQDAAAADLARQRFDARSARLAREAVEREADDAARRAAAAPDAVQAALERARARRRARDDDAG